MLKQPTMTTMTVRAIAKGIENEEIKFDNPVQRGFVWDDTLCSGLIHSVFCCAPIPPIYAEKSNAGKTKSRDIYDVLDGQQRCTAMYNFVNDQFALTSFPTVVIDDTEYELDGMKFSECPEEVQNAVLDYSLYVFVMSDMTQNEKTMVFRKLNDGKELSNTAKKVAYCGDLDTVYKLGKHPLFEKILTPTGFKSKTYVSMIMKMYAMLHAERNENDELTLSFEGKYFNKYSQNVVFSDADKSEINALLDYANEVIGYGMDIKKTLETVMKSTKDKKSEEYVNAKEEKKKVGELIKKLKKETNLISFVPYMKGFMDMDMPADSCWKFMIAFFDTKPVEYNRAAGSDTSKTGQINKRDKFIADFLEVWIVDNDVVQIVDEEVVEEEVLAEAV